jgi:hypothetical protein
MTNRQDRSLFKIVSAVAIAALPLSAAAQCAMCRASLAHSEGGADLISGLQQGIGFLLAVPVVICALVVIMIRRSRKIQPAFDSDSTKYYNLSRNPVKGDY